MNKHIKRIPVYLILAVVAVFLIAWAGALIKCEILTNKYHGDFESAYKSNTWISDIEYFKVLNCDGETAQVYYVTEGKGTAFLHNYELVNGEWVETKNVCVWSISGSASEVIWPYWWHFVYGGF